MKLRLVILLFCAVFQCGGVIMRGSGATPAGFCGGFTTSNLHCNSFERASATSACTVPNEDTGSSGTASTDPASPTDVECDCQTDGTGCINIIGPLQGAAPSAIPAGNEVAHLDAESSIDHSINIDNAWADGTETTLYMRFCVQMDTSCSQNPSNSHCSVVRPRSNGDDWDGGPEIRFGLPSSSGFRTLLACNNGDSDNSSDLALDVWHTLTVAFNEANGNADMWINQDSSGASDISCTGLEANISGPWDGYRLRMRSSRSANANAAYYFDMIDVAASESDLDDDIFTACPGS